MVLAGSPLVLRHKGACAARYLDTPIKSAMLRPSDHQVDRRNGKWKGGNRMIQLILATGDIAPEGAGTRWTDTGNHTIHIAEGDVLPQCRHCGSTRWSRSS